MQISAYRRKEKRPANIFFRLFCGQTQIYVYVDLCRCPGDKCALERLRGNPLHDLVLSIRISKHMPPEQATAPGPAVLQN